ncbi:MAG TPA: VWA domain-containing protein [Candidatus Babeliales bacterium]|nr:VWA domain-containing protein [Candidatus Babeliales bacterium]
MWGNISNLWIVFIAVALCLLRLVVYGQLAVLMRKAGFTFKENKFLLHYSSMRRLLRTLLFCIGTLALGLAFLHPQWGKKEEAVQQQGRDLFILLDVSKSMLAQDMEPSRLEFAKKKIKQLVDRLATDRVALVLFAGRPIVQCPLTQDIEAFKLFLDQTSYETVGSGTTALDVALKKVIEQFERAGNKKSKLAVIFTDGEDFSHNLAAVRQEAQDNGLFIFAQGLGTADGAPIPVYDRQGQKSGVLKDDDGSIVISRLNESLLKNLVTQIGGVYIAPTENQDDVEKIYAKVQRFEKEKFGKRNMAAKQEQYPWFIAVSYICFLLEWIL